MSGMPCTRRWPRQEVDLPVCVGGLGESGPVVPGRAAEISEGGMAVYAGMDLRPNDLIEVEFRAPSRARVTGVIRNRSGYCFGVEFARPLPVDDEERVCSTVSLNNTEQLPEQRALTPAAARMFEEVKAANGAPVAYLVLARVLQAAGMPGEAQNAFERALAHVRQASNANLGARELLIKRLREQIDTLRVVAPALKQAHTQGKLDPRIPEMIRVVTALLREQRECSGR
jgi:hypothetical protein